MTQYYWGDKMSIERKNEHIKYAIKSKTHREAFKDVHLLYNSIPELDFNKIDTTAKIFGREFNFPILINAMTGGSPAGERINKSLSLAGARFNIPFAVGSQSVAIKDKILRDSFTIARKVSRNGFILANVGAGVSVEEAKQAAHMIEADGLQLHLNVLQELVMPEGDREFSGILENIYKIVENISIPVIVKEVGFGMTLDTVLTLKKTGIKVIDIGGLGGTNFAKIEWMRRYDRLCRSLCSIGIPTPVSLHEACKAKPGIDVVCGGGIRNGLDITKALIMGADFISVAYPLLEAFITGGENNLFKRIEKLIYELKVSMIAAGASNIKELQSKKVVITGKTMEWINQLR